MHVQCYNAPQTAFYAVQGVLRGGRGNRPRPPKGGSRAAV